MLDFAFELDWLKMGGIAPLAVIAAANTSGQGGISDFSCKSAMGAGAKRDATSIGEHIAGGLRRRGCGGMLLVRKGAQIDTHGCAAPA